MLRGRDFLLSVALCACSASPRPAQERSASVRTAKVESTRALPAKAGPAREEPAGAVPAAKVQPPHPNRVELPWIAEGACPFECCQYGKWTALEETELRATPSREAHIVHRIPKGRTVQALTGHVKVVQPARVRLQRRTRVHLAHGTGQRDIAAGQILFLLYPVGEGFMRALHAGVEFEVMGLQFLEESECARKRCPGVLLQQGRHEWWIHIRDGNLEGWTDSSRPFDGADACG
jgi:hypothetical protein